MGAVDFAELVRGTVPRLAPVWVATAAAVGLMVQALALGIRLRAPEISTLPSLPFAVASTPVTRMTASHLTTLVGAHLFGVAAAAPAAIPTAALSAWQLVGVFAPLDSDGAVPGASTAERVDAAEETSAASLATDLQALWGEAARVPAQRGPIAWLREGGGPAMRVQLGQSFAGGTVTAIEATRVTLELGGRRAQIAFAENPYVAMFRGETDRPTEVLDGDSTPAALASKQLRFQPAMLQGGQVGFRLYPGAEPQALARLGLAAGDVLEAVEDQPALSGRALVPLLRALKHGTPVTVRVRRGPKVLALTLNRGVSGVRPAPSPARSSSPRPSSPRHAGLAPAGGLP